MLCLLAAAPAAAFLEPVTKRGNLDADSSRETVRARPYKPTKDPDDFERTQVTVTDTCDGEERTRRIVPVHDNLERLSLKSVDRRRGKEVFVVLRDGARGVLGEARLVAWRGCRPRKLFRYDTDRPTRTPRGGTGDIESFAVRMRNASRRYRGLEIVVDERFVREGDPPTFGSIKKVSYYRFSARRGRYVRYASVVRRLRVPG